ncbi:MAG: sensor histidine kinase [Halioglobus sp.]
MRLWPRRHSLSGKLVLLFLLMAVLFVVLVGGSMSKVFRDHLDYNVRPHLSLYLDYVQQDIGIPPDRRKAAELAKKLHVNIHIVDSNSTWASNGIPLDYQALEMKDRFQRRDIEYGMARQGKNEVFMARSGDTTLYFDVPNIHPERKGRGFIPMVLLLLVLLLLYYLTQRMIRPVATLQAGVRRFGQGDLDYRVKLKRRDELGELADDFNEMADDIQQMLDAKRQLLLAISHELRSPLTRAKVSLALIDDGQQKQELGQDLAEMERLIEELLETERLSTSHRILNKQTCDLTSLIEEILQDHFMDSGIGKVMSSDSIALELDGPRIKLLLKNLLENALRHTPQGAEPPQITLSTHRDAVNIAIQDYGEGIAVHHIPFLTEPFYRGDASRRRETGGYGLGLYLCRVIVEAHGGQLAIESEVGSGTTVQVQLPLPETP